LIIKKNEKNYFTLLLLSFVAFTLAQNQTINSTLATPNFDGNGNETLWNIATWISMNQIWIPYNNILPSIFTTETGTQLVNGTNNFTCR
jgi:hypothetical protein